MASHIDVSYTAIREAKKQARNTGTKVVRVHLGDDGEPTGKLTLRNGRGESKGSFTVDAEGKVKVHKAAVKREKKQAQDAPEATDDE